MYKHRLIGVVTLTTGMTAAASVYLTRRLARRSGATTAEVHEALPGDELVAEPQIATTRAITIHAPVAAVWPWVVQVGYHRGGWYTNARLDKLIWHINNPSADRILPEFQHLDVGDTVPDGPEGTARFTVAAVTPGRMLALYDPDSTHLPDTRFSWVFVLREVDGESTRLILRTRADYPSRWWMTPLAYLALGPADFLMAHVLLLRGIKLRAEHFGTSDEKSAQPEATSSATEHRPASLVAAAE
jgi:hypothetical protein